MLATGQAEVRVRLLTPAAPAPHSSKGPRRSGSTHSWDRKGRNPALKARKRLGYGLKLRAAASV